MNYKTLLKNAPPQDSPKFIEYLRAKNKVVWENPQWIIIENCKYHTKKKPWLTAFWKGSSIISQFKGEPTKIRDWYDDIDILWYAKDFAAYEWVKKAPSKQTVPDRFHIHLVKK